MAPYKINCFCCHFNALLVYIFHFDLGTDNAPGPFDHDFSPFVFFQESNSTHQIPNGWNHNWPSITSFDYNCTTKANNPDWASQVINLIK